MFAPSDADLFRDPRWHISELVYDFRTLLAGTCQREESAMATPNPGISSI